MATKKYFAFPYTSKHYVLGAIQGSWIWFYAYYWEQSTPFPKDLPQATVSFLLYEQTLDFLAPVVLLDASLFEHWIMEEQEALTLYFDEKQHCFQAASEEIVRKATIIESLSYVDIIASQHLNLAALKLRLLETSLGFIPSFQYVIEQTYQSFFAPYWKSIASAHPDFTRKKRKQTFNQFFKEYILPFAQKHGLERITPTSKRLIKRYENDLSVVLFFEHINFGLGAYAVNVVYFDAAIGSIQNDDYLAMLGPNFPYASNLMIRSQNASILKQDLLYWIRIMELYVLPFMDKNATHQAILQTLEQKETLDQQRKTLNIAPQARQAAYYFQLPTSSRKTSCLQHLKAKASASI